MSLKDYVVLPRDSRHNVVRPGDCIKWSDGNVSTVICLEYYGHSFWTATCQDVITGEEFNSDNIEGGTLLDEPKIITDFAITYNIPINELQKFLQAVTGEENGSSFYSL